MANDTIKAMIYRLLFVLLLSCIFMPVGSVWAAPIVSGSFSTTWQTDNPGTSNPDQISFSLGTGGDGDTCSGTIYWEEVGNASNSGTSTLDTNCNTETITFPTAGMYRVDVLGTHPSFSVADDPEKLLSVEQWGDNVWETMRQMFVGAVNLEFNASDVPDLSVVINMTEMFKDATNFNSPIGDWDVSNVLVLRDMFYGATAFNQDISSWDVSNVTVMIGMFRNATAFNQPLGTWDTSKVENLNNMFFGATAFNQDISSWDTTMVTGMSNMFRDATSFNQPLNNWNVAEVVNMDMVFSGATAFNQPLGDWDLSSRPCQSLGFNIWNFFFNTAYACTGSSFDMANIFADSGMDTENYSLTLQGWSELSVLPQDVDLGIVPSTYCNGAQTARDTLIANGWIISDEGAVACAEDDTGSSGGSTATRVGDRLKSYFYSSTTSSTPMTVTKESFFASVKKLVSYLHMNEDELRKLSPSEAKEVITGLRDILAYLVTVLTFYEK
jgi:surface protein